MLAGRHKALALIGGEFVAADRRLITFVISLRPEAVGQFSAEDQLVGGFVPARVGVTGGIG